MDGTHETPTRSSSALLGAFDASIPTLHHASFDMPETEKAEIPE